MSAGAPLVRCSVCNRSADSRAALACRVDSSSGCIANYRTCCASSVNVAHARSCRFAGVREPAPRPRLALVPMQPEAWDDLH